MQETSPLHYKIRLHALNVVLHKFLYCRLGEECLVLLNTIKHEYRKLGKTGNINRATAYY